MVNKAGSLGVNFNAEQQELYNKLKGRGLLSAPFREFVRSAYYDKLNQIAMTSSRNRD